MTTVKAHRFPVSIEWQEGRLTLAMAAGKPDLEIATPPEFKDGIPAKDVCLVSLALDTPVHLDVRVAAREVAPVA